MEHRDVVLARRMVRRYDPDRPLPEHVLADLLDQASRASSAGHSQGRDLLVLREDAKDRFWAVTAGDGVDAGDAADASAAGPAVPPAGDSWLRGMRTAPVLVLCLSDPQRYVARYAEPDKTGAAAAPGAGSRGTSVGAWPVPWWDVDTGMAALLLLLGATDAGLGACFFGVPDHRHDAVRAAFDVPADRRLVGVVSLGHPAADRRSPSLRRGRRPLAETVHEGRFGTAWAGGRPTEHP